MQNCRFSIWKKLKLKRRRNGFAKFEKNLKPWKWIYDDNVHESFF